MKELRIRITLHHFLISWQSILFNIIISGISEVLLAHYQLLKMPIKHKIISLTKAIQSQGESISQKAIIASKLNLKIEEMFVRRITNLSA